MRKQQKLTFYWSIFVFLYLLSVFGSLIIEQKYAWKEVMIVLSRSFFSVKAFYVLLMILTFVIGEAILLGYREKKPSYPLLFGIILFIGYVFTHFLYFAIFCALAFICTFIIYQGMKRHDLDDIEKVMQSVIEETSLAEADSAEDIMAGNEEPEIDPDIVAELDQEQQIEIDHFLNSLFAQSILDEPFDSIELTEPLAKEILEDANDILADVAKQEEEEIMKVPPKEVILKKKQVQLPNDPLEAELDKKEEPLGEFDEEIPMDEFVEESTE